jgi:GTPase SAR1 family protein
MRKKSLCLYCFRRMKSGIAAFRCVNPDQTSCKPEVDKQLSAYERIVPPMIRQRTFEVAAPVLRGKPKLVLCPCGYETWNRICTECHNSLPSDFDDLENYTIGLIGAKEVGKSNYIGVLVDRLANEVSLQFGGSLNALDERTTTRYRDEFRRFLDQRMVVPVTQPVTTNKSTRYPLSYSFSFRRRYHLPGSKFISLSLFDTAGEHFDHDDEARIHVPYILNSNGLILLLDPLQLGSVRDDVPKSTPLPNVKTDPAEIVDMAIRILKEKKLKLFSKKISVPVAVVFSKIDAVLPLFEVDSPLHDASEHQGAYDDADGAAVHESVRAYLVKWGGPKIDRTLASRFSNYRYFGVSSFGDAPVNQRLQKGIAPFRVEDPFLWLLYEAGFISKKKIGKSR